MGSLLHRVSLRHARGLFGIALFILMDVWVAATGPGNGYDYNGDGFVNGKDAIVFARAVAGLGGPNIAIDFNGDLNIDVADIVAFVNLIHSFPSDPHEAAPPVGGSVATDLFEATKFLYSGNSPGQTGVTPGAINPLRVAVLRGRVLGVNGQELSGVKISIVGHPEFGSTISRLDGYFDMAVGGGGVLTIDYARDGFIPAQRRVESDWLEFIVAPNVVLMAYDSVVTTVDLNSAQDFQVHQAGRVED